MDPIFASVVITALIVIVAVVAIVYRQKDIAALALKMLGKSSSTKEEKPEETQGA